MARASTLAAAAALTVLAAGASGRERDAAGPGTDWRSVASDEDRDRLRSWRGAWTAALKRVRGAGADDRLDAALPLFTPDAALGGPAPPPGDYRCRVYKLGAVAVGGREFTAEPPAACRVTFAAGMLGLAKLDGAQRPSGWLYPDAGGRMIFLGAMRLADERRPLPYGIDAERDMAGILERIGADRWRLVLPRPRWEAMLTVVELRPAG